MIVNFSAKRQVQINDVNHHVAQPDFIAQCEAGYQQRVDAVASEIVRSGCVVTMLTGPSASGKTTSSRKLAKALGARGHECATLELDRFFKNIEDYPENEQGQKDLESVYAVDIDRVNICIKELIETGRTMLPEFDFINQKRKSQETELVLPAGGLVIIEGIHALNPLLSSSVADDSVFRLYAGLREEYFNGGERVIATRDLRIARRLVRDYLFRGYSIENTLSIWNSIMAGEDKYIKVFKQSAHMLLDTSFGYEAGVFGGVLAQLAADDANHGGSCRAVLEDLANRFSLFTAIPQQSVPQNSMLREFIGGLEI